MNTGLFISTSGISEIDCATTKTDTAERSISIGRESLQVFFFVLGVLVYFQVPPLGGSSDEKWRSQWMRKRSVSWNLPKLSQLWLATEVSDHVPHRTTYRQNNSWMVHEFQQSGCLCAAKWTSRPIGPDGLFCSSHIVKYRTVSSTVETDMYLVLKPMFQPPFWHLLLPLLFLLLLLLLLRWHYSPTRIFALFIDYPQSPLFSDPSFQFLILHLIFKSSTVTQ